MTASRKTNQSKKITGVVINKNGEICTPNKLLNKTHNKILKYKEEYFMEHGKEITNEQPQINVYTLMSGGSNV